MVGYPESLTDPSYRGQILILTFPIVGNYGVPPHKIIDELPAYFESLQIHIAALVVGYYSEDFSHYLAESSLSDWLKKEGVPAICGVDTRALTKKIRESGVLLGKLICQGEDVMTLPWCDPNAKNLVAEVSIKTVKTHNPPQGVAKTGLRVLCLDVGMKTNQLRCFLNRGCQVKVVPWDYKVQDEDPMTFDGLFISNGPGDPATLISTIANIRALLEKKTKPIFGICLGHQLLALAAGAQTKKLKFGNRGHNIPCIDMNTGKCYITSQNHGYAVDVETLQDGWQEYWVNANDGSNEGMH